MTNSFDHPLLVVRFQSHKFTAKLLYIIFMHRMIFIAAFSNLIDTNKTVWVMIQGLVQTLLVRLPMAYFMSIQPNASLTNIGLAAPTSTAVGIVLNVCFFLYLERKSKEETTLAA